MSTKALALKRLYDRKRISREGLLKAVDDGIINLYEFNLIVGE